tara:strand:- start:95157 stop:95306 length:150 start_codon:yes stop_codon:yes gene_type:complete
MLVHWIGGPNVTVRSNVWIDDYRERQPKIEYPFVSTLKPKTIWKLMEVS